LILFNAGFEYDQGLIKDGDYNALQKECLKSFESLCVFGHREFYKNLLCILVEMYNRIYGMDTIMVPKRMMDIFGVWTQQLVQHMMRQGKFKKPEFPQSYIMVINGSQMIVRNSVTRPVQFSLGKLPIAATFTDKQGSGWNETNIAAFFNVRSTNEENGAKQR
jgi:hypothetical protein